jgi:protein SCO1
VLERREKLVLDTIYWLRYRSRQQPRWGPLRRAAVLVSVPLLLAACGSAAGQPGTARSTLEGIPATGLTAPDFALHDQAGALVRLSAERGRYVIVTFLYVHCPNVCPIIAGQLNEAIRELGPARADVRVFAVSVDPKGDTPPAVRHFIAVHRLLPQFRYLTGTVKQLEPVWHGYHIASTQSKKGVVVGHTAISILLDRRGKPRAIYDAHVTAAEVVHDLRALGLGGS